jgi:hypothetical protein
MRRCCLRWNSHPQLKFAPDSPLEGNGFELGVPGAKNLNLSWVHASYAVRDPRARQPDREELVESLARVAASETLRREEHIRTYKIAAMVMASGPRWSRPASRS